MMRLALYIAALFCFAGAAWVIFPYPATIMLIAGALLLCVVGWSSVAYALRTGFIAEDEGKQGRT